MYVLALILHYFCHFCLTNKLLETERERGSQGLGITVTLTSQTTDSKVISSQGLLVGISAHPKTERFGSQINLAGLASQLGFLVLKLFSRSATRARDQANLVY